ncbi:S-methyl thiohydantoin desulfurase domain-containing protein, partial [Bacillus sp. 9J]|uniref:S-methyl thiohydantoin desulfurase domain-containing protein n=2 Tax=Bacillati TaxID=1783272 RepID=UPI0013306799
STPSVITVVDARSLAPVATDRTRVGNELAVLVLPSAPWWWADPDRTAHMGPRAFGIDADVVPEAVRQVLA